MSTTGNWCVYIVKCSDNTLYTGITMDVGRRIVEHNSGDLQGAKYTRGRRPVCLVYQEFFDSRSAATKRENKIKQLSRAEKEFLIKQ